MLKSCTSIFENRLLWCSHEILFHSSAFLGETCLLKRKLSFLCCPIHLSPLLRLLLCWNLVTIESVGIIIDSDNEKPSKNRNIQLLRLLCKNLVVVGTMGDKGASPEFRHISKHFLGDLPLRPIESLIRLLLLEILSISYVCKCWKKTTSIQTCCKRNKYHSKICVPDRKSRRAFLQICLTIVLQNCQTFFSVP